MKSLRPFFSYFGAKWRIAKRYPIPQHDSIIEPFAGSAGYSLRHSDKQVCLYDAYTPVVVIWQYLISASESEILSLPDIRNDQTIADLSVCEEAKMLIGFWLNAGVSAPCKQPSAWMKGFRDGPQLFWGERVRKRISKQQEYIRHWTVAQANYWECPDMLGTWFIDPPYQKAGKDYPCSSKEIDFNHLMNWSVEREGQIIVCENSGANWLPFEHLVDAKATHGETRRGKSKEVMWHSPCPLLTPRPE